MTEDDACRVLNVARTASPAQIRQAYLDLVKVWHPDRFEHDARLRERAVRSLQDVNEAYAVLQRPASTPRSQPEAPAPGANAAPPPASGQAAGKAAGQAERPARDHDDPPRVTPHAGPLGAWWSDRYRLPILGGSVIGVVLAVVLIVRAPAKPPVEAPVQPATDIALPSAPARDETRARRAIIRPESGTDVRPASGTGRGTVSMRNASSADAVVVMRGDAGLRRTLYLRRGEKITMLDVAPGDYHVEIVFGREWLGRAFAQPAGYVGMTAPVTIGAGAPATALVLAPSGPDVRSVPPFQLD